jgi:hypothetical protein
VHSIGKRQAIHSPRIVAVLPTEAFESIHLHLNRSTDLVPQQVIELVRLVAALRRWSPGVGTGRSTEIMRPRGAHFSPRVDGANSPVFRPDEN